MHYAIISDRGKQYKVEEGNRLLLDRFAAEKNKDITFKDVLLIREGETVSVGQPFVAGAAVTAEVEDEVKGEKIRVSKFKAKVRYRKTIGFRPLYTKVLIKSISVGTKADRNAPQSQNRSKKINREKNT